MYFHFLFLTGLMPRAGGGQVGVLVFFVLSGYLITRILWAAALPNLSSVYTTFLRRRATRLYPPLVGVVIVCAPVMAYFGPESAGDAIRAAAIVLTQTTAFFHLAGAMPDQGWLHAWSLTVEWLFYLLWPLVVLTLRVRQVGAERMRRVALALACMLYLASLPLSPLAFYYAPLANLAVMLVGAALALGHVQRSEGRYPGREPRVSDMAFVLFLVIVFLPSNVAGLVLYRYSMFPIAVIAAYVILDQRPGTNGFSQRLLESRPMRALGLSSYSLYLWHLPVLWTAWWALPEVAPSIRVLIALAILVPAVFVSYRLLEKPRLRGLPSTSATAPRPMESRRAETLLEG
ncbi:hypothetical protein N865_09495 [Intrasporangium oryzae NRRL B-24470]|uniref:Acyltransferase 3 domain-containing protein n=1 Tax=Intrasporangium oryzae NRRL B-24470 TaxID=1386089 RepID=W9GCA3_9MICO|nr:hypothetical protein N865_09495 [Intrasporangium oryzae NRRL B-24470]